MKFQLCKNYWTGKQIFFGISIIVLTSCRSVLQQWNLPLNIDISSANMENVEGLALSQEGKSQTHSGKVCDMQHISDFSQQDYQVLCVIEVHVGLLWVPTTW